MKLAALVLAATICGAAPGIAAEPDYVLELEYETRSESRDGTSRSSSSGHQAIAERIIARTQSGVELEYSASGDPADVRGSDMWMFPARVLVAPDGSKRLLNPAQLEARLDTWLADAGWKRDMCSRWLFTWTAMQIECDPQAAIEAVEAYGLRPGPLAVGTAYDLPGYGTRAVLDLVAMRNGRRVLRGSAEIDPAAVRESEARSRTVAAEIMGETLSYEDALADLAAMEASGTVSIEFEIAGDGLVWRREKRVEMVVTGLDRGDEDRSSRTIVTRVRYAEAESDGAE